ncbi:efflux transporter outer membrane subunit [Phenylobacterium montanum]|uniref:Efflux transporter outer membrane subunit n=1 Tax=Phenylobacterium montanum TaxID=2823693 RepID=A0A975IVV7_9CAUL|nr:efflux transporter outer membrane subunit [Caulobacter sp. S6]QUD89402.1 efflux transporter outer membrane subunit [Caulobacter sp. S6]
MARSLPALALAFALPTAACVDLAPADRRPPAPVPASFPAGPAYAPATSERALAGWRAFFADPKLKQVIEQALANNRDLRIAVANVAAARAQFHVQRAAQLPTVTANAAATQSREPAAVAGAQGSGAVDTRLYSLTAGVSAYQLDLFGKLRDQSRAAQEQYLATAAARDAAQITLVSEVAGDYLTLAADRDLLKIAQDTLSSSSESLKVIRSRFEHGVGSQLDVSQADTIAQQARFDVARLTTQVAQDRNALELVVGAPVGDELLPAGLGAPVAVLEQLPAAVSSSVLLGRPDVIQAEDQLKAANANIGAARAAFFPDISLTGSGGLTSLALSSLFKSASGTWSFAPAVSQTLFDAGANRGDLDYAKAQRQLRLATYEKAIQTAFREVADALAQRGTIDEQVTAQRALTAAAADSLRLSTARYERGSDTYLNVLVAQRTYYGAEQTLVATELARSTNLVALYTSLGGGLN